MVTAPELEDLKLIVHTDVMGGTATSVHAAEGVKLPVAEALKLTKELDEEKVAVPPGGTCPGVPALEASLMVAVH